MYENLGGTTTIGCYTIPTIIGFHISDKIAPRPNLPSFKVYWQPFWAINYEAAKKIGRTLTVPLVWPSFKLVYYFIIIIISEYLFKSS